MSPYAADSVASDLYHIIEYVCTWSYTLREGVLSMDHRPVCDPHRMLICCMHRTDFPGGIIWWHDYDIAKRRGHLSCLHQSATVHMCAMHTQTLAHRFNSSSQYSCIYHTCTNTRTAQAMLNPSTSQCGTRHCRSPHGPRARTRGRRHPPLAARYAICTVGRLVLLHTHAYIC